MTDAVYEILSPQMKVMKCKGGISVTFLAESSGKFCILFSHRILHEQQGLLTLDQPTILLSHLMDSLLVSLDSALYPDAETQDKEWFSSQSEALSIVQKMWD